MSRALLSHATRLNLDEIESTRRSFDHHHHRLSTSPSISLNLFPGILEDVVSSRNSLVSSSTGIHSPLHANFLSHRPTVVLRVPDPENGTSHNQCSFLHRRVLASSLRRNKLQYRTTNSRPAKYGQSLPSRPCSVRLEKDIFLMVAVHRRLGRIDVVI